MKDIDTYPITIRESRYNGVYSGGDWIIMTGIYSPEKTDAFGSDSDCSQFWTNVDNDGPVIELTRTRGMRDSETKKVYVASGNDPGELLEEMKQYLDHQQ